MKILFWLSIGLDRRATSEHLLTAMIEALYKQGHTVHVLQKDTGGERGAIPEKLEKLGVTTSTIKHKQVNKGNLVARYIADLDYAMNCKKWIKKNAQFDRVFMQSCNIAGIQVRILREIFKDIPITFNVQDIFPENAVYSGTLSKSGIPYKMLSAIQKYAYRRVDRIITISEDMKDQLVELGTPANKIEVIYNWSYQDEPYDLTRLDYTRVAPLFDKSKFNVVYAGNIGRMQNVEIVIQAAAQMRERTDIAFHVFGDGVYKNKLVALAQQLNADNVTFHPMMDSKDAPALYASADVNVIPLAKDIYRTALPSKTATCLACGKPIIFAIGTASKFGQIACGYVNGKLEESDNVSAIVSAVEEIRNVHTGIESQVYYRRCFSITSNSHKYAHIISR